ncbi:Hypp9427 [Branchiostoma lanceolatum]|uniref:Hypp9427 protein n=1 Tax=Branchiostoma lanceolatum TaxID=7740 RepID=A0A8S4MLU3_BRALA|nr:Hypp9427 [Branchiostoma lanceolatum]
MWCTYTSILKNAPQVDEAAATRRTCAGSPLVHPDVRAGQLSGPSTAQDASAVCSSVPVPRACLSSVLWCFGKFYPAVQPSFLVYSDTLCLVLTSQECRSAFRLPLPQIFAGTIGSSNRRPIREGTPPFIISEGFNGGYESPVSLADQV